MLDMVFQCEEWGSELCNFIVCCCQVQFWHFHIVGFSLCKIDLDVHLLLAFDSIVVA